MARAARVYILDIPYYADIAYTYLVPEQLADSVECGRLVEVPLGRGNRSMTGLVAEVIEDSREKKLKPIHSVLSDYPILTEELSRLTTFVKEHTLCTFGEAMRAVIPASAMSRVITYYQPAEESDFPTSRDFQSAKDRMNEREEDVYSIIIENPRTTRRQIQARLPFDCTHTLSSLSEKGLIMKSTAVKNPQRIIERRMISMSEAQREAMTEEELFKIKGKNRQKIARYLSVWGECEEGQLYDSLFIAPTQGKKAVESLKREGIVAVTSEEEYRNHFTVDSYLTGSPKEQKKPKLSREQSAARDTVVGLCESGTPAAALLHGVTGSGKTNVILSVIERVLEMGRGVIMLVPEIALTPQTVSIFLGRFGDKIAVIHSSLSAGERYDAWRRIRDGRAEVVVGTRSAIFAPLRNIGLIVIDEEHEYTYKSDTNPKYSAHDIARFRCKEHNAVMLLSSATPSVTSYYKAKTGVYTLVELKNRYGSATLPDVKICDMRGEVAMGNISPIGSVLADKIRQDKQEGNQSIIFLNRRGYNNYVSCRSCGRSLKCPNCSVSLTYHAFPGKRKQDGEQSPDGYLTCHTCGYRAKMPEKCPDCGKDHFLYMGYGTQKAEDDIEAMFPDLRVLRMDLDTTRHKHSHEELLTKFRNGEADMLLGTQMVTKGHDFPKVATVGVINADAQMMAGDFRANERCFAMLTQVAGRAGRADVPGVSIIQTYNPDSEVIRLAATQDYPKFYEGEIKLRKALTFPPFCDIAVVTLSSRDEGYLGLVTTRMYEQIVEHSKEDFSDVPLVVFGPFEAPVYRVQGVCRMRFVIKCRLNKRTREFLSRLICEFGRASGGVKNIPNPKKSTITVSVDLNPSTV